MTNISMDRDLEGASERVVPPSGFTARLTVFTSAAMAFLAVFALALSLAMGRLADSWADALARTATVRISAPAEQQEAQTQAVLAILSTTPGIESSRVLSDAEQQALLEPWFGPGLPLDQLPVPRLVEIVEAPEGYDADNLKLRLSADAPGALLDDHDRWRRPLVAAAERMRLLGFFALALIVGSVATMITLAAQSALAANVQVIRVLRLVGARDVFIARAFVKRFSARAFVGALAGTAIGVAAVALIPPGQPAGALLVDLRFSGTAWAVPLAIPPMAAVVAYLSTRFAAMRLLKGLS